VTHSRISSGIYHSVFGQGVALQEVLFGRQQGRRTQGEPIRMSALGHRCSLGLRANWRQFAWYLEPNAFIGGLVGPEWRHSRRSRDRENDIA
jgi:hypothetical protein